ncbi:MAG: alpha/beta fold hydrolase [Phycisphaerales bacterium]|jgi:pimeloyl-ACP methyl ester carboxylesterase
MTLVWLVASMLAGLGGCSPFGDVDMSTKDLDRRITRAVRGNAVSYVRSGSEAEPRLIYVHGTPGDAGAFAEFVRNPIDGVESISVDRPGFGKTGGPALTSFADQAAALEPLLVEREGTWPVLVGHSLGGPIIARMAADHPDRVAAIVIIAGSLDPDLEDPRWFNYVGVALGPVLPRMLRVSNAEIFAAREQTERLDAVLVRVRCPVVIVHGTRDGLVPYANVEYMQEAFTGSPLVETVRVEGAGHFVLWGRQEIIRDAISSAIQHANMRGQALPKQQGSSAEGPVPPEFVAR